METRVKKREQWSRKTEYFLAAAGNVVGLGNLWRFPYLCYKNGGGVFLLPYCFFALLCGVPLFMLETAIGQYGQEGAMTCWTKFCPLANGTGYSIMMIQLYSRLYAIVLAWALLYLIYSFRDPLPWTTCNNHWNTERCVDLTSANRTAIHSSNLTVNWTNGNLTKSSANEFWERGVLSMSQGIDEIGSVQWELVLCLLACWVACYFCIWKGVRTTGKVVYFTAVFPYVMLAILLVRGLTLPGAWQGVVYYLYPDPSRLADLQVWMEACAQVLFSYGVASGTVITLSSYNKVKNNCYRDSLWLCALNSGTSFVAGFAVFSALGYMAHEQGIPINMVVESGPGLAFIAFPQAVAMMPLPQLWAVCFFFMLILLGLDTVFAGLETITSSVIDLFPGQMRRPWRREIFLIIFSSAFFLIEIPLASQGGVYLFQLFDHYAANGACILFVSLAECVAIGWAFVVMDLLHSSGVSSTHYLQTHFSHSQGYFLSVSMATDLRNTFFLFFPIWFHVQQAEAIKLVWVAVVGDWVNLMLKWLLFGERPYWWVQETDYYGNSSQPMIEQFPMTCETGPGSPSGHAMGTAAVYYTMMSSLLSTVLKKDRHQIRRWCMRVSLWTLFWCVQVCVCLSRVFVAAHFPHQVITGVAIGILVAESLSRTQQFYEAGLRSYLLTSLLLLSLALLLYLCLQLVGVDVLWSVEKARCWCRRAEWVSVDTSPLASLFRNTGTLLGLGLGLHYPLHAHTNRVVFARMSEGIYRLICLSATLVLLQLFDFAFRPPVHSGALFYLLSFCKSATVPLATVAVVPYCVTAALTYTGETLL